MLMQMDEMQARLDDLVAALDGQDAGAIIAASESLATAVILFRGAAVPPGSEPRARTLIGHTLKQLEAAAIRVNVLKDWTRQRIDRNHALRGIAPRGAALSY
jgi:citrate lyase beta subunit